MTENEMIEKFLKKEPAGDVEKKLQIKTLNMQEAFRNINQDLQNAKQAVRLKEEEFFRTRSYLELCYSLIVDIERK